jgi:hypothetical protein
LLRSILIKESNTFPDSIGLSRSGLPGGSVARVSWIIRESYGPKGVDSRFVDASDFLPSISLALSKALKRSVFFAISLVNRASTQLLVPLGLSLFPQVSVEWSHSSVTTSARRFIPSHFVGSWVFMRSAPSIESRGLGLSSGISGPKVVATTSPFCESARSFTAAILLPSSFAVQEPRSKKAHPPPLSLDHSLDFFFSLPWFA